MSYALQTKNLTISFGGLKAVANLDLSIPRGHIYGMIGPNGAGKTTVFNMLTGVYTPTHGTIEAYGKSIVGFKPFEITRFGIARTFQNIRLFKALTVLDNLVIALDQCPSTPQHSLFASLFKSKPFLHDEYEKYLTCMELLKIFKLDERSQVLAHNLPYGDQRRLEIARALATGAKIILLDEPAAGMNAQETWRLMQVIRDIRQKFDITILLIEHDMKLVMGVCEHITVLDHGEKIAEGTAEEIQNNPKVIEAYLGKVEADHGKQ